MIRLLTAMVTLTIAFGCGSAEETAPICEWFERCGDGCAVCDDGNPCTEDRCIDRVFCGHVLLSDACSCTRNCEEGDGRLALVQALSQGDGGLPGFAGVRSLVVTADERHAYVASPKSNAVTWLFATAIGLKFRETYAMDAVTQVAMSQDERFVVAASKTQVKVFQRSELGALEPAFELKDAGAVVAVCDPAIAIVSGDKLLLYRWDEDGLAGTYITSAQHDGLSSAGIVVFSSDCKHIYAPSFEQSALLAWRVDGKDLVFVDSYRDKPGLLNPDGVAASPDGKRVYVAGFCDHNVGVFERDSDSGALTFLGAAYSEKQTLKGCNPTSLEDGSRGSGGYVLNPSSVSVSPDSSTVLVGFAAPTIQLEVFSTTDKGIQEQDVFQGTVANLDELGLGDDRLGGWSGFRPPTDRVDARGHISTVVTSNAFWATSRFSSSVSRFLPGGIEIAIQEGQGGVNNLVGAYTLNMSPDSRHLYVGPRHHDRVGAFAVDAETGALRELPSPVLPAISESGAEAQSSKGAVGHVYVVRPHGRMVVATESQRGELHFLARDVSTGHLSHTDSVALPRCDKSKPFPADVVTSPDGKSLYVADFQLGESSCIYHYTLGDNGLATSMTVLSEPWLAGIETFAQSESGNDLYAACYEARAIAHYRRDGKTGELSAQSPVVRDDLEGVEMMALTPGGEHLYASSPVADRVVAFNRNPGTGALSHLQTLNTADGYRLDGAAGMVVDPSGKHLYVAARMEDAVVQFAIDGSGKLTQLRAFDSFPSLDWVNGIVMTPSGDRLYTAAVGANAVSSFRLVFGKDDGCGGLCP